MEWKSESPLTISLGQDRDGKLYLTSIGEMPHLLIAGTTGSGKSVCIHSIIASILSRATPQQVKLLLIDPKRVELSAYAGVAHLYDPNVSADKVGVITNPSDAVSSLKKLIQVMETRYEKYSYVPVRNIDGYNAYAVKNGLEQDYHIVVIIDELSNLMMVASKDIESVIQRLSQMARSAGIHLVLATQRPSVNVITGTIKANFTARIAFKVSSQVDSRVILDRGGAEDLAGKGDMLYLAPGEPEPIRLQGSYVSDEEIKNIVEDNKKYGKPSYDNDIKEQAKVSDEFLVVTLNHIKDYNELPRLMAGVEYILRLLKDGGFISCAEGNQQWKIEHEKVESYLGKIARRG